MRVIALVTAICLAHAANADVVARVEAAFEKWTSEHGTKGTLALLRGSDPVLELDASIPREMASLSKAVTAVCLSELVREGRLDWDDEIEGILGPAPEATLGGLLTHAAGFWPDSTQTAMPGWLDTPGDRGREILQAVTRRGRQAGLVGRYAYNNENYAILGEVITSVTGTDYLSACAPRVLEPAGVHAELSPRTGGFGPMGGLRMTTRDYARFHAYWFGGDRVPSTPQAALGGGVFYGPGTVLRAFRGGRNYWHFGLLCFPGRLEAGSYAATWEVGYTVTATFDKCLSLDTLFALDRALAGATYGPEQ